METGVWYYNESQSGWGESIFRLKTADVLERIWLDVGLRGKKRYRRIKRPIRHGIPDNRTPATPEQIKRFKLGYLFQKLEE